MFTGEQCGYARQDRFPLNPVLEPALEYALTLSIFDKNGGVISEHLFNL
jgi:hypothetical protein